MHRRVLPLVVPILLVVACGPSRQARPTPPPPFAGKPIYDVPTSEVDAYGASLQFDTTRPAADTLTVRTPTGDTIHLEAAPEIGAASLVDTALATGRIIARVQSSAPFSPLGTGTGTTYFWVSGAGERARGEMIPADSQFQRIGRPLIVRHHLEGKRLADRFIVLTRGGVTIYAINGRCDDTCCGFTSDFLASDAAAVDSAIDDMHKTLPDGT